MRWYHQCQDTQPTSSRNWLRHLLHRMSQGESYMPPCRHPGQPTGYVSDRLRLHCLSGMKQIVMDFFFEDISPFRGDIDTPVLDFWWRLPWVSKPGWIPCLRALSPACKSWDSPLVRHLLVASMVAGCFGFLVTSTLGFKARVNCVLSRLCHPRFTSGATPADCIEVSMAAEPFWSTNLQTSIGGGSGQTRARTHDRPCRTMQSLRCIPLGHSGSADCDGVESTKHNDGIKQWCCEMSNNDDVKLLSVR